VKPRVRWDIYHVWVLEGPEREMMIAPCKVLYMYVCGVIE